jgi:hypothetical protein
MIDIGKQLCVFAWKTRSEKFIRPCLRPFLFKGKKKKETKLNRL